MSPRFHLAETRQEDGWRLAAEAGERQLPLGDFLAVFAWDGRLAAHWESMDEAGREEALGALPWKRLKVEDWGALNALFAALP